MLLYIPRPGGGYFFGRAGLPFPAAPLSWRGYRCGKNFSVRRLSATPKKVALRIFPGGIRPGYAQNPDPGVSRGGRILAQSRTGTSRVAPPRRGIFFRRKGACRRTPPRFRGGGFAKKPRTAFLPSGAFFLRRSGAKNKSYAYLGYLFRESVQPVIQPETRLSLSSSDQVGLFQ